MNLTDQKGEATTGAGILCRRLRDLALSAEARDAAGSLDHFTPKAFVCEHCYFLMNQLDGKPPEKCTQCGHTKFDARDEQMGFVEKFEIDLGLRATDHLPGAAPARLCNVVAAVEGLYPDMPARAVLLLVLEALEGTNGNVSGSVGSVTAKEP